jgi:hypothetical protein
VRAALDRLLAAWDRFFFARTADGLGGVLRILFACVCFLNMALLAPDLQLFFSESGVMPLAAGRAIVDPDTWTLFSVLPATDGVLWTTYAVMMLQLVLLGLGVWPRLQAASVFLWLCTFQHRNYLLFDAEDNLFRLMAFFLVFLPLHRHTVVERLRGRTAGDGTWPLWPFRLVQLQMCLIFASTSLLKLSGDDWRDGTAMYYVVHLDDLYGGVFNPTLLFGYLLPLKLITWGTMLFEAAVPLVIWSRRARPVVLAALIAFHAGIHLSMNLNLFHAVMLVGWLSFLAGPLEGAAISAEGATAPAPAV